jgi:hypothetical protein
MAENGGFEVVGKVFDKLEIVHLIVRNSNGEESEITMDRAIKAAGNHQLNNARLIKNIADGTYVLDVRGGYSGLKTYPPKSNYGLIELKARLINNGKCIGYKAMQQSGKSVMISLEKTWNLAYEGCIDGVKAEFLNNVKVLKGDIIDELPKLVVNNN